MLATIWIVFAVIYFLRVSEVEFYVLVLPFSTPYVRARKYAHHTLQLRNKERVFAI